MQQVSSYYKSNGYEMVIHTQVSIPNATGQFLLRKTHQKAGYSKKFQYLMQQVSYYYSNTAVVLNALFWFQYLMQQVSSYYLKQAISNGCYSKFQYLMQQVSSYYDFMVFRTKKEKWFQYLMQQVSSYYCDELHST